MLSYVLRNDIYLKTFTGIVFAELSIKRCYKKTMQLRAKIQENYNFYCYHTGSLRPYNDSPLNDHLPPFQTQLDLRIFHFKEYIMTEIITGQTSYHHKSVNRIRKKSNELLIVFFLSQSWSSLTTKQNVACGRL